MFGCCVAGRPVQTNLQQIDETHAAFELIDANRINHICVFLLGTVQFPPGIACTVHFFYPGKGFQLLGALSNDKPSAIFQLRGAYSPSHASSHPSGFANISSPLSTRQDQVVATLGFSLEPVADVQNQIASLPVKPALDLSKDPVVLAERIVQNLFNYLAGFTPGAGVTPESMVPMNTVAKWFENFKVKLQSRGLSFLDPQN